jgi:hypothetical protein
MKVCNLCGVVFKDDILTQYVNCPIRDCPGEIIEIDENLFEVYRLLQEKGYCTKNCCSAHSISNPPQTYIQFCGEVDFPELPAGFSLEIMRTRGSEKVTNIYKRYPANLSSIELQKRIWETMRTLLDWAEKLCDVD